MPVQGPVDIAQMLAHQRIGGHQLHRFFQLTAGFLQAAEFEIDPAEGIDDMSLGLECTARFAIRRAS